VLDRDVLEVVELDRVDQAEHPADAGRRVRVGDLPVGEQLHLLQLLRHRHPGEQGAHLAFDPVAGMLPGGGQRRLVTGLVRRPDGAAADERGQHERDGRHQGGPSSGPAPDCHGHSPAHAPPPAAGLGAGPVARSRVARAGGPIERRRTAG